MENRQQIVDTLGSMLEQAARSSVAKGAHYEPGENINLDSKSGWHLVAETLVSMVEALGRGKKEVEKTDVS